MNIQKLYFSILLILLGFNQTFSQQSEKLENSVLWKIEHPSLEKASYLYGTMHMLCEENFSIPSKVLKAMKSSEELILEINLQDPKELMVFQNSMATNKKISEEISPDQFQKLDSLFKSKTGADLIQVDKVGLSNVNMFLMSKMLPCKTIKSIETELMLIANNKEMPINSLEKAAFQMELLKLAYPTEFAYKQIMLFDSYKKDLLAALEAYQQENIEGAFQALGKKEYMDENATNLMLKKRNTDWVEKIPEIMKSKSVVFAVGAAHLVNDYGVINQLREKGFKLTPVLN